MWYPRGKLNLLGGVRQEMGEAVASDWSHQITAEGKIRFDLSCLGRPSNPALLRMRNVTFQPKPSKAKNRGWRAFQEALSPGAPGPPSVGPRYPEAGSSLALKGVQRRLEVSLLAKSGRAEPAPGAAGAHRRPRAGCRSHGTPWGERSRTWAEQCSPGVFQETEIGRAHV